VGFDVLTTCQPSTVWCSRERLPAAATQPAKVRQSCSATDLKCTKYEVCISLHSSLLGQKGSDVMTMWSIMMCCESLKDSKLSSSLLGQFLGLSEENREI
jgi:hypothetical protein